MKERKILWRLVQSDIILDSALDFVIRIRRELKGKHILLDRKLAGALCTCVFFAFSSSLAFFPSQFGIGVDRWDADLL